MKLTINLKKLKILAILISSLIPLASSCFGGAGGGCCGASTGCDPLRPLCSQQQVLKILIFHFL